MAKSNQAYTFTNPLMLNGSIVTSPTIAAGDVKVQTGSGTVANADNLPTGDSNGIVTVTTSASENDPADGSYVTVVFIDQTDPKEWDDLYLTYNLTTNIIDDLPTLSEIMAQTIDGSLSWLQVMRILLAFAAGLSNGGGTSDINFRDNGDSKNRIAATVDANGNRTAVTLDGT